jgi:hypothetical protein
VEVLRFGPRTVISVFLGGMALAVGLGFVFAFWHDGISGPLWIGATLAAGGAAILAGWRTTEIDPITRRIRIRRGWLFFSSLREMAFDDFSSVSVARTPSSTPSFCVQLIADYTISLPTQGRDRKGARSRARRVAQLMGVPLEEKARQVSSVPMI